MDLNLAPWRYRNILCCDGGPIEKIEVSRHGDKERTQFEAVAFLNKSLLPEGHNHSAIYSGGHGGGTSPSRNIACHIAISEALERWAFLAMVNSHDASTYGFDIDPSTSGMAAFPGLTSETARHYSNWEAIERWALAEWWLNGSPITLLPESNNTKGGLRLLLPFRSTEMVLLWETTASERTGYGFAAAKDISRATQKALVELNRNLRVLNRLYGQPGEIGQDFTSDDKLTTYDRRMLYFSSPDGSRSFHKKVKTSSTLPISPRKPRKVTDREIPGPWSRYARVWRTLYFEEDHRRIHTSANDIFVF